MRWRHAQICGGMLIGCSLFVACQSDAPTAAEGGAASGSSASARDWPQFRGPSGTGASTEKGLPTTWSATENIAWKTDLPGAGTSAPIIVGDRIFVTCYSGYNVPGQAPGSQEDLKRHVVCLNRKDGKLLWDKSVESKLPEQGRIRDSHGYASSTPASDGERVYAFFGKSGVVAMDFDGKQLWHADVGDGLNGWGSAASVVLHDNLVFINASVESGSLYALDKKTGKEVWKVRGIKESWNTPVLVQTPEGKTELVVAIFGKVLGFEPSSGEELWSCATDIPWYMVPTMVADKGIVYCLGGRPGYGLAVKSGGRGDVTSSHRLWTSKKGSNVSSPVYHDGHLYWFHDNLEIAYCANAKTGEIEYEQRVSRLGGVYASPLIADGKIYQIARYDGRVYVVAAKPSGYEQLAVNDIGAERGEFNTGLVAAEGKLYLRTNRQLYCIGKE